MKGSIQDSENTGNRIGGLFESSDFEAPEEIQADEDKQSSEDIVERIGTEHSSNSDFSRKLKPKDVKLAREKE